MSHLPFHPAPGFGDLAPGWLVLPQNPVRSDGTVLVPSVQATAPGKAIKIPSLADLVAASFAVPQNPLMKSAPTAGLSGCGGLGCGCSGFGCDGGANFYSLNGLGQTTVTTGADGTVATTPGIGDWLQAASPIAGIPNWVFYGALAGGALLMSPAKQASKRAAGAAARRLTAYSQNPRHRNVQEGFYSNGVFHPIRASADYSAVRAGEALPPRRPTKKKKGWRY